MSPFIPEQDNKTARKQCKMQYNTNKCFARKGNDQISITPEPPPWDSCDIINKRFKDI